MKKLNQELINTIIGKTPGNIYWKNLAGVYLGCNENQAKFNGVGKPDLMIGKSDYDFLSKAEANTVRETDLEIIRKGEIVTKEEFITSPTSKKEHIFLSRKEPLREKNGAPIGILGISIDITEKKKTEEKLEYILNTILANLPNHIYWKDKNGKYLGCNDEQARTLGFKSAEAIIGKNDFDLFEGKDAEAIRNLDVEVMRTKKTHIADEEAVLDGKKLIYNSKKVPLFDSQGNVTGILGVSVDITEKERLLDELIEKLTGMTMVAASIAHELRTPLSAVRMGLKSFNKLLPELIKSHEVVLKEKLKGGSINQNQLDQLKIVLNSMGDEVKATFSFIDMMLKKLTTDVGGETNEIFSIKDCINNAMERYPFTKAEKPLVKIGEIHDFKVNAREELVTHVIFNLVKNALYYISVALKGDISIWTEMKRDYGALYFRDTGPGMTPDELRQIFNQFYTKTPHGAGVGLHFCRSVMEALGGSIECESVKNEFTQFKLKFPIESKTA